MGRKLENFNDRSMRVVQLSNLAALSTRSTEICTEHLLVGLVRGGNGVMARVLTALGVELTSLKRSVLSVLPPSRDPAKWRKVPFSPLAERVFDHAREQAASLGKTKTYVGTSHLLLGLLKVEEGTAFTVLAGLGVTYSKVRDEVIKPVDHGRCPPVRRLSYNPPDQRPVEQVAEQPRADCDLIEKTKREIRKLVHEIEYLAKRDIDELEFYQGFLPRVISCLAAQGGAVWTFSDSGALKLNCQMNLPANLCVVARPQSWTGLFGAWLRRGARGRPHDLQRHTALLQRTLSSGQSALVEPHWGEGDGDQACNPTDHMLILGVLMAGSRPKGVVEVFQRPGAPPTTQRGYLKFVDQVREIASRYLQRHQ